MQDGAYDFNMKIDITTFQNRCSLIIITKLVFYFAAYLLKHNKFPSNDEYDDATHHISLLSKLDTIDLVIQIERKLLVSATSTSICKIDDCQ